MMKLQMNFHSREKQNSFLKFFLQILEPDLGRQCYEDLLRLAFQGKKRRAKEKLFPEKTHKCVLFISFLGKLKPYVGLAVPFQEFAKAYQAINSRSIIGKAVFLPQQFNHSSKL